jgi:magnesium transporter
MDAEDAEEVRELLGFEENTAGGFMTNEFIMLQEAATVEAAINELKNFSGELETIHAIYLVSQNLVLTKVVPLVLLLISDKDAPLHSLVSDEAISVPFHADRKTVINMFHRYNLLALPVVDDNDRLLGVVTADDVLELVIKEK